MRADPMMARSTALQAEAAYIDARPYLPDRRNHLHRTAGPYIESKCEETQREQISSAVPHRADLNEACRHFAEGTSTDSPIAINATKISSGSDLDTISPR